MSAVFNNSLKVGDMVVSTSGWRGEITHVDEKANKWPYTVMNIYGTDELFNGHELTKVEIKKPKSGAIIDALKKVNKDLKEAEELVAHMKIVRDTLECQLG